MMFGLSCRMRLAGVGGGGEGGGTCVKGFHTFLLPLPLFFLFLGYWLVLQSLTNERNRNLFRVIRRPSCRYLSVCMTMKNHDIVLYKGGKTVWLALPRHECQLASYWVASKFTWYFYIGEFHGLHLRNVAFNVVYIPDTDEVLYFVQGTGFRQKMSW
jgi:hypothetical protein